MERLSRDDLIEEVKYGRISPAEAEAEAAKRGLPPFATTPNPRQFNPADEVGWTLPMTVAWIAWRDPEKVLQFYDPYRAQCFDWHYRKWRIGFDGPIYEGHFLHERPSATFSLLALSEHFDIVIDDKSDRKSKVSEAKAMLWKALQEHRLEATGLQGLDMPRIFIPAHAWHDLEPVQEQGRDAVRTSLSSQSGFDKVLIARRSVLALWPNFRQVHAPLELPPTVRPDGPGDFPLYCAAQWIATQGGTRSFEPSDASIWDAAFDELKAHIASGHVSVTGVRNGRPEKIEGHIFSSALRVGPPFSDEPLDVILSDDLYLSPCPYIDSEHWQKGFNDSLQSRNGAEWTKLTVLKSEIAKCCPFPDVKKAQTEVPAFRTGAPGRPTPIHLVVAEHRRRLDIGEAEIKVTAESEHLADWLKRSHPSAPPLTPKTIQNKIRAEHRAAKNARN